MNDAVASYDPTTAWTTGMTDEGSYAKENVGVLPFASRIFTNFFKIAKVTHVLMAEGQTHVHRINFKPNKVLCREVEYISNANIKRLTIYQMVVCYGTPSDPLSTVVTTCPCKIDYVVKKQYTYKWSSDTLSNYFGSNNLPTTTGQHTMDIGSGADHVVASS